MKKESIIRTILAAGFVAILVVILIPEVGTTRRPDWQLIAKTKLKSLIVLYATYTTSGARFKHLKDLDELAEFSNKIGGDSSLFSTFDRLNRKETSVAYFKPQSFEEDELLFVFEDPILRMEKKSYTQDDLKELRYIACYTKSGIVSLESKPTELNQSEQVDRDQ